MNSTEAKDHLCTTRQAADLLGVSLRTVQLWVEEGVLPAWKTPGGHRRIARSAVEALIDERDRAVSEPPNTGHRQRGPLRLLVVEDEPDLLKLYRYQIEFWDTPIELVTAADGFEGLLRIGEESPDLVFTDLNMPGMDGFKMIRSLIEAQRMPPEHIVVVTALGQREIAARGGLPEGIRVFPKPIPFDELERIVQEAVRHYEGTTDEVKS